MKHVLILVCGLMAGGGADAQGKADLVRSQNLFRAKCASCHSVACHRIGPKLEGLMGRPAGGLADYKGYTQALRDSGIVWSEQTLDDYIRDPARLVPGTSMDAAGKMASAAERRDIVAHMRRQDRSIDLCIQ